ncbi:MAG: MgtC/SapB family protein [Novipirellula sp. JB048]
MRAKKQKKGTAGRIADTIRIKHAHFVGISFLGAGTIIHHQNQRVEGLTTAASILLTAGIGIAVGIGALIFAAGITLLAVIVLTLVGGVERRIEKRTHRRGASRFASSAPAAQVERAEIAEIAENAEIVAGDKAAAEGRDRGQENEDAGLDERDRKMNPPFTSY